MNQIVAVVYDRNIERNILDFDLFIIERTVCIALTVFDTCEEIAYILRYTRGFECEVYEEPRNYPRR